MPKSLNQRVWLATQNPGKLLDLQHLLSTIEWDLVAIDPQQVVVPKEGTIATGATLTSNAQLKAEAVCAQTGGWALADDSGLFVEALPNELGVDTAHFGGPDLLLKAMQGVTNRNARFSCVLALARPNVPTLFFTGHDEGLIAQAPAGQGGFAYDPVFVQQGRVQTNAERIDQDGLLKVKSLGHRGQAAQALCAWAKQN